MESLTITKWRRHFHANKVIADVRVRCIWLPMVHFNCYDLWALKVVFIMSMTLKTTKNMCCGLSVVFKITTRRSTIDVRKKSDLSRKNRTTGSPGHVRKIWDWPQPANWWVYSRSRRDVMRLSNKRSPYLFGVATANRTKVTTPNKYGAEIIACMSHWENPNIGHFDFISAKDRKMMCRRSSRLLSSPAHKI